MKRKSLVVSWMFFALCLCLWTPQSGAKRLRKGVKSSLKTGELIRFQAKVGSIKGGTSYLFAKKVRHLRKGTQVTATIKARTNNFFDKIHKINNDFLSRFRLLGGAPFFYHQKVDQAGSKLQRTLRFKPKGKRGKLSYVAKYKRFRGKKFKRTYRIRKRVPRNTHNLVSAMYYARFLPFRKGKTYTFHVFVSGRLWKVSGRFVRRTKIYTVLGAKKALLIYAEARRLHRRAKPRKLHLWLSDDSLRIPLKAQGYVRFIGTTTVELIGYRRSLRSRYLDRNTRRSRRKRRRRHRRGKWSFLPKF